MEEQTKVLCDECDKLLLLNEAKPCPLNDNKTLVCVECCNECGYNEDGDCTFNSQGEE